MEQKVTVELLSLSTEEGGTFEITISPHSYALVTAFAKVSGKEVEEILATVIGAATSETNLRMLASQGGP